MSYQTYVSKKVPFNLANLSSLLSTNVGARDKVVKLVQYIAKLVLGYYSSSYLGTYTLSSLQQVAIATLLND